eukprot:scaffold172308_cov14-Prasinocladus_malaysianus.AAC.1
MDHCAELASDWSEYPSSILGQTLMQHAAAESPPSATSFPSCGVLRSPNVRGLLPPVFFLSLSCEHP